MVGSMYGLDPLEGRGPVIAVIGGGASGTLAVIHLLRSAAERQCPLRVVLIDRHGRHGLGQAYSTAHPAHLLNAAAGQMSALAGDPGHLMRWAGAAGIIHDGFLARRLMLPFVRLPFGREDALWLNGLAGAIPAALAFLVAGTFLYLAAYRDRKSTRLNS